MLWTQFARGAAVALALALPVAGCDDPQTAEKTGQNVGRAVDQAAERVGEAAGDVAAGAGRLMKDAGQAIERAAKDGKDPEPEPPRR